MSGALAYNDYEFYEPHEIINGKIYMMSSPSVNHIRINSDIDTIFKNYLNGKTCEAFINPNVYFSNEDHFIPDEIIVCNPEIIGENSINGAPDLVVEILSKSTAKNDKTEKLFKYGKYGVKEYWIVNPWDKSFEVYLLKNGELKIDNVYQLLTEREFNDLTKLQKLIITSEIKVSIYDDFIVKLEDIFRRVK